MSHLKRHLAPLSTEAWNALSQEATRTLKLGLAGRRLVDFSGPHGWAFGSIPLGRVEKLGKNSSSGVELGIRQVQPLVEIRVPFTLKLVELEAIDRACANPNLDAVVQAAQRAALTEDQLIFQGNSEAGIEGIFTAAKKQSLKISDDYEKYPRLVAEATNLLRSHGIEGPYAIALGPQCYQGLSQTTSKGGYPILQHVKRELEGPIVWAPALKGAIVLSLRGGDFQLTVGQDFSVGYLHHNETEVTLYLEESLTFQNLSPQAAVPLLHSAP